MSTTIKRVALVAVAALGLGVLSVAPSSAVMQMDTLAISATTASQTAGDTLTATSPYVTASFLGQQGVDTMTLTASLVSGPTGNTKLPKLAMKETTSSAVSSAGISVTVTPDSSVATFASAKVSVYMDAATVAGAYVVKVTPTGSVNAAAVTVTITVAAKTLGWNTAFIATGGSGAGADATVAVDAAASTTVRASMTVAQGYGATASVDTATAADAAAVVVSVDKGLVSKTNDYTAGAKSVTTAAGTAATNTYYFFSNGDVGVATVSITVGTTALTAKKITYKGAATALKATLRTGQKTWIAPLGTTIFDVTATDAALTTVTTPTGLTVKSSDTSIATVAVAGNDTVTVTGVKAGTVTITVTDPATTGTATPATFDVTVKPAKSTTAPTISFDKTAYNVGDLVTMTVAADMADSATATLFATKLVFSSSIVATSTVNPVDAVTHAIVGGKATYTFYAPAVSGTFTVKAKSGAEVDITDAVEVSKTVDIVNTAVDAATEAAEQAAQNADDATNAALAAADAADEATAAAQDAVAAVAELSAKVNTLIKALKAQITTLTNLVIKIQKKVKA